MSDPDYRAQARAVRAAARQRLRELSQRRGAQVPRWQAAAQAAAAPPPPTPADDAPAAPLATAVAAPAAAPVAVHPAEAAPAPVAPQAARPLAPAAADPADDAEFEADGHDLSVMTVSMAASAVAQRAAHDPAALPADPEAARVATTDSDLSRLPGVGPGLVWLLTEAGVPDCAALSRADSAALADRLGLVGRLVDIGGLQALAAEQAPRR